MRVKLVLFDALYTIVKPRAPIHVQYAQVFEPYLGTVDPTKVKTAFKIGARISHRRPSCSSSQTVSGARTDLTIVSALKDVQRERPAYAASKNVHMKPGAEGWWAEVIGRTAVGAGSDPTGMHFYPTRVFLARLSCLDRCTEGPPRDHTQTDTTIQFKGRLRAIRRYPFYMYVLLSSDHLW
jgi:hypothetical protein